MRGRSVFEVGIVTNRARLFLMVAVAGGGMSCRDSVAPPLPRPAGPTITSIELGVEAASLPVGDTLVMFVEMRDSAKRLVTMRRPRWSSSNPTSATVDSMGVVRGRHAGTTRIVAAIDG